MGRLAGYAAIIGLLVFAVFIVINGNLQRSSETLYLGGDPSSTDMIGDGAARELELTTLLGFDAIRSIENPRFIELSEAMQLYQPDELVLGVSINGDSRAYSVPLLSRHEIVNDVVGGKPIAVTW